MIKDFYNRDHHAPSYSTTGRVVVNFGNSRKIMEHRHLQQDHTERLIFLENIGFVNAEFIMDIDEMSHES
jgi:hypothetical protein